MNKGIDSNSTGLRPGRWGGWDVPCGAAAIVLKCVLCAAWLVGATGAVAQTVDQYWANPAGGSFTVPSNWSSGVVADADDNAIYDRPGDVYTVSFPATLRNRRVEVLNGDVTFDLNGYHYSGQFGFSIANAASAHAGMTVLDGTFSGSGPEIASPAGSRGTLTVGYGGGVSASWVDVGKAGSGAIVIKESGRGASSGITLGGEPTGRGELTITDGASRWSAGVVVVGGRGTGVLTIKNRGTFESLAGDALQIAAQPGSSGTVSVADPISVLRYWGPMFVGGSKTAPGGSGQLILSNGGHLELSGPLKVYETGSLTLDGGILSATELRIDGGFDFKAGTINLNQHTGVALTIGEGGFFGDELELPTGKQIHVRQGAAVNAGASLKLSGGQFSAGTLNNAGTITLASPTAVLGRATPPPLATLNNSGLVSGNGTIAGTLNNTAGGEVRVTGPDRIFLTYSFSSHSNAGTINLVAGGTLEAQNDAGFKNLAGGVIQGRGTLGTSSNGLTNLGRIHFGNGSSTVLGKLTNLTPLGGSPSEIALTGGATGTFNAAVTLQSGSVFRIDSGSQAAFNGPVTADAGVFVGGGTKSFSDTATLRSLQTAGGTVVEPTGAVTVDYIRESSLEIRGNVSIRPKAAGGGVSLLGALKIAGSPGAWVGRFDIADTGLVLDYGGDSPLGTLRSQLHGGRAGGKWDGAGITTSSAAADSRMGVGYAEAAALFGSGGGRFEGQDVDATSVVARLALGGDANLDGDVSFTDLVALAQNYGGTSGNSYWTGGDFTYDGNVGFEDLVILAQNYGAAMPVASFPEASESFSSDLVLAFGQVPEPGVLVLGLLGVVALPSRSRRS